ncbi:spore coat protein CotJB [Hominifimenecus sp. rT4P-3]|uniref:spore coat protein CotJB n=1 Tax=Hominifimenecus sp. rT4P-3 TaxID=3242979 RepID=UPI003DA645AE
MQMNPLMKKIYEYGFAVDDVVLYLDTHPDDAEALAYYQQVRDAYEQFYREYVTTVGPLMFTEDRAADGWSWTDDPWPWEGGMC